MTRPGYCSQPWHENYREPCAACRSEAIGDPELTTPAVTISAEQAARNATHAAEVRAAITHRVPDARELAAGDRKDDL